MSVAYTGPLRDEPLAVELYNTLYAAGRDAFDGLEQASAWLDGLGDRFPNAPPGLDPSRDELAELRAAVRAALQATVGGKAHDRAVLDALNRAAARALTSPAARWRNGRAEAATDFHGASRADVVLAALAVDAIALITGPHRDDLRACGAPGCVLMFLKDHPRRAWCSDACGNRARQARHYERRRSG
jgi:predicted RNA-binding Zn ribbon-like protein